MAERIYKLQPNRTMALRGFDHLGASGAMHSATADSFKVTGNFRDPADFCVLMVWDVDDFYEHPSLKYLPDASFQDLVLTFDAQYTGLQPLDSNKYATIDWPYLDGIYMDGKTFKIPLFAHATQVGGNYTAASATFTVEANGTQHYDRVTLWYQNSAYDCNADPAVTGLTGDSTAAYLANMITGDLQATASSNRIQVSARKPGVDGNMLRLYQTNKNDNLKITPSAANLSGGDSAAVWRISLDFNALLAATTLQSTQIRKMWLTFAPPLANGAAYIPADWEAVFTNWNLTGPEDTRKLQVAGQNSVRIHQLDSGCTYSGTWVPIPNNLNPPPNAQDWRNINTGFYDQAFAARAHGIGSTARVKYSCASPHDLYIGTSLSNNAGLAGIQLDGDAEADLNCALVQEETVVTRREVRANVAAGIHELTLVLKQGQFVDFNFLEAAVPSDIPAPFADRATFSPALDYDTDHTYKLPPARILWNFDQLGFRASINEYLGVFWWNQRTNPTAVFPSVTITFGGTWVAGESIWLDIGPPKADGSLDRTDPLSITTLSKSVFPVDTSASIALHFSAFINGSLVGVWASATGAVLTITARSPSYSFALERSPNTDTTAGTIAIQGQLTGGVLGDWIVDPSQTPVLNTGTRAWHTDFYALANTRGTEVVTSISMELVNPPQDYPARFPDGPPVITATGFGTLNSTHCALGGPILSYQAAAFSELASLQSAAGLTPCLQMGEFLWWFFAESATQPVMAYYDNATKAAALAALGRDLHIFTSPNDAPQVNAGADAIFLRNRLRDHASALVSAVKSAHPSARFEVLLPLDVNYPTPVPADSTGQVGGQLNHFVNIPVEWSSPETAGFDFLKIEALAFGSWMRNLDLAEQAIDFPETTMSWPLEKLRYLVPVFGTASAWQKEARFAAEAGYSVINFWAFDHICLYGWDVRPDVFLGKARSSYQG